MSAISGISITCFASSYFVAWLLELSRLFFRSGVRGAIMLAFAAAGFVAPALFVGASFFTLDFSLWRDSLFTAMIVNAVAFFVLARPMTYLARWAATFGTRR